MNTEGLTDRFRRCGSLGPDWPPLSVCIAKGDRQHHVGICIRAGASVKAVHLAWHNRLTEDDLSPTAWSGCMRTGLPEARQRQVIARVALVREANGRYIPYGFTAPTGVFDEATGRSLLGPTGLGLTCASFVLAIFEFSGVRLLAYEQWPARQEDRSWRDHVIKLLARSPNPDWKAHAAAIQNDDRTIRYRPEEVTAAAGLYPPTASFEDTARAAGILLGLMSSTR